jgi:GWxTD domain-containing protein
MNRFLQLVFVVFALSGSVFAQAGKLKAYIDQKTYFSPETGNYAEIQIQFVGYSLKYQPVDGGLQSNVAINVSVVNSMNDTVASDAYVLQSPVMRDSIIEDFFDILRFPLQTGDYSVNISLQDIVSNAEPMAGIIELAVPGYTNAVSVSDVMIAEVAVKTGEPNVFSKSGFDILPRISNFYPADLTALPYYVELYNTPLTGDSSFAIRQRIISTTDAQEMKEYTRLSKMHSSDVVPLLRNIDISKLPSGSYRLEVAILDRNEVQQGTASYYYFERVNDLEQLSLSMQDIVLNPEFQLSVSDDSLKYFLASLIPIARPAEVRNIIATIKENNNENIRKYLQLFWIQTSGASAYNSWINYKKQVWMVESLYGNNFLEGYETDRGRVYLQYGPPNQVVTRENSPTEYPYEIWHYYKIKVYSNKRFVFFNPDLVNENYRLLHSDMVGEQQNYRWQQALAKRNSSNINIDDPNDGNNPHYGDRSTSDFNITR